MRMTMTMMTTRRSPSRCDIIDVHTFCYHDPLAVGTTDGLTGSVIRGHAAVAAAEGQKGGRS